MIRVLIVDDLNIICEALKAMLLSEKDLQVVGFAHDGKQALEQVAKKKPDVVLIDVLMPLMNGIKASKVITQEFPDTKVIVLSASDDNPSIIDSIIAGAKGYLLKDMPAVQIASAIRTVYRGGSQMAPGILEKLANKFSKDASIKAELSVKEISQAASIKLEDKTKKTKPNGQKPLFKYGDWISLTMGIAILSQVPGMGHWWGHAGLTFLMLALIARPISSFWNFPLRHRRTIGILAFAFSVAHLICATREHLNSNLATILSMPLHLELGMWAGILSLIAMIPAAVTSFQYLQKKLGKRWKQIHLLTVPGLILALVHTLLVGPDYMSEFRLHMLSVGSYYVGRFSIQGIDLLRALVVALLTLLVLLTRKRFFSSLLGLNKAKTHKQSDIY